MCLFFMLFICGMVAVFAYGFSQGKPKLIVTGWDSDGMGCGLNKTTENYPALYWPKLPELPTNISAVSSSVNLTSINATAITAAFMKAFNNGVCVKECPKPSMTKIECKPTTAMLAEEGKSFKDCVWYPFGVDPAGVGAVVGSSDVPTVAFRYPTVQVGGFCMPDLSNVTNAASDQMGKLLTEMKTQFFSSEYG
jgi:hypothetical protein